MRGYVHGEAVKVLKSDDGQREIEIVARHDGRFQFYRFHFSSDEHEKCWVGESPSGLYFTQEAAEADATTFLKS